MNECFGCSTCKSADKPLEKYIAGLPMETSHHRVESQSTKCGFGLQGVCCPSLFQRPLPYYPESAQRYLRSDGGRDRCPEFLKSSGGRIRLLYPYRGEHGT